MILGTAGHVDHGKTALIKALTGVDTDRLPEEKKRGMTLELGFAHLTLPNGTVLGVIDVPGHERFVKAMAAGAGGVDIALLVIAADEGVMPQTREHIDICTLLGVRSGIVVVTKSDLLPDLGTEWETLLRTDIREAVMGSAFEASELVFVSAKSGAGLDSLKLAIQAATKLLPPVRADGPLFLPIDRAFSIKGFGCVVTGTVRSGTLMATDDISLVPGNGDGLRIRGLQVHGSAAQSAPIGTRVAVNLSGIEPEAIERGRVLTRSGELPVIKAVDVQLSLLPSVEHPLSRRSRQLAIIGTQQIECVVALVDVDSLRPGEACFAQLRFGTAIAALPQQKFVLRGTHIQPGRGSTIGGGTVLTLNPPRRRKGAADALKKFAEADVATRLQWLIDEAGYSGLLEEEVFARASLAPKEMAKALDALLTRGLAVLVDKEPRRFLSKAVFTGMTARARARLEGFHAQFPEKAGMSREELKQRLGLEHEKTFQRLLSTLREAGQVEVNDEVLNLPGRGGVFDAESSALKDALRRTISSAQLAPPTVGELETRLRVPIPRLVKLLASLVEEGHLVRAQELFFDAEAVKALEAKLALHFEQNQELTTQQFKELTGQSRKFVIPLAEYFDAQKITLRVGEVRVLRKVTA